MDYTPKTFGNKDAELVISGLLDKANQVINARQTPRDYLGASRWGHKCSRALRYEYEHTAKDTPESFPSRILRIFDMGHTGETRMANYLREAGFDLLTERVTDGRQLGFKTAGGKMGGHIDGIILSGPAITGIVYPLLWENKCLNDKSWKDTLDKGVAKSKPLYYSQLNTYMAYSDEIFCEIDTAMFTAENRDTGEVLIEIVKFDAENAQESSDRALRVVNGSSPAEFSRLGRNKSDFECKFCDYKNTCWAR